MPLTLGAFYKCSPAIRFRYLASIFAFALFAVTTLQLRLTHNAEWIVHRAPQWQRGHHSATPELNSTLGFERIVAVSSGTSSASWRIDGLLSAGALTGLSIDVPAQPEWTDAEVDAFRGAAGDPAAGGQDDDDEEALGPGQARCWLGHLNALREMLANGWQTALVVEDDADWDVEIRRQAAMVAPFIRDVAAAGVDKTEADSMRASPKPAAQASSPYGDDWDLLWLGHCGDSIPDPFSRASGAGPHEVAFIDPTLPTTSLHTEVYGEPRYHPPQLRVVHATAWPTCTFAYAVTRDAAMRIHAAAAARGGFRRIITRELREWCVGGGGGSADGDGQGGEDGPGDGNEKVRTGLRLRCLTVSPELFHHHKRRGESGSEIARVEGQGWEDLAAPAAESWTANIRYSARCNAAAGRSWGPDGDEDWISCEEPIGRSP